MRNTLLGSLAGLVVGVLGMAAYQHFMGQEMALQAALDSANTNLAAMKQSNEKFKSGGDALAAQLHQLTSSNDDLKRQVDELKKTSTVASAPDPKREMMIKEGIDQQLLLYKSRLNLTPEQEATLRAAMEDSYHGFIGWKKVDQMFADMLNPDQKVAYQQMKDDQKKGEAETSATSGTNQVALLIHLTDAQKDQVYSALYQLNLDSQGRQVIFNPADPASYLDDQAKATENALAKILTPEQLATYHQQAQSQVQMQKARMQQSLQQSPQIFPYSTPIAH